MILGTVRSYGKPLLLDESLDPATREPLRRALMEAVITPEFPSGPSGVGASALPHAMVELEVGPGHSGPCHLLRQYPRIRPVAQQQVGAPEIPSERRLDLVMVPLLDHDAVVLEQLEDTAVRRDDGQTLRAPRKIRELVVRR